MFGESDSESPRAPSPWDVFISPAPSPHLKPSEPSQLHAATTIPCLIPENDEGNIEYKLQLLDPSPDRFARLVTQLRGRLLEGGGQAFYEIGVADSGSLVGLPRAELERSLQTLDMMAGEIGASVIIVKEIEVPAAIANIAASQTETWSNRKNKKNRVHRYARKCRAVEVASEEGWDSSSTVYTSTLETSSATEADEDLAENLATSDIPDDGSVQRGVHTFHTIIVSKSDPALCSLPQTAISRGQNLSADSVINSSLADLEISAVFKPRPRRMWVHKPPARIEKHARPKRLKKIEYLTSRQSGPVNQSLQPDEASGGNRRADDYLTTTDKALTRKENRDRRREDKRRALIAASSASISDTASSCATEKENSTSSSVSSGGKSPTTSDTSVESSVLRGVEVGKDDQVPTGFEVSALVSGLSELHVTVNEPGQSSGTFSRVVEDNRELNSVSSTEVEEVPGGTVNSDGVDLVTGQHRLIVEALVVRKMSLEERYLNFGGFALE